MAVGVRGWYNAAQRATDFESLSDSLVVCSGSDWYGGVSLGGRKGS